MPALQIIHVNQHVIKKNRLTGERRPPLTTKKKHGGTARYGHRIQLLSPEGELLAEVVYQPDKPLSCGAHC